MLANFELTLSGEYVCSLVGDSGVYLTAVSSVGPVLTPDKVGVQATPTSSSCRAAQYFRLLQLSLIYIESQITFMNVGNYIYIFLPTFIYNILKYFRSVALI